MDKQNSLKDFLNDIAFAIQEAEGSSEPIPAQDFGDRIRQLSTGGEDQESYEKINLTASNWTVISESGMSYTFNDDETISVIWTTGRSEIGLSFTTKSKIDFTNVDKVVIEYSSGQHYGGDNISASYPFIVATTTYDGSYMYSPQSFNRHVILTTSGIIGDNLSLTLDTSGLIGEYYIALHPHGWNAEIRSIKLYYKN